MTCFRSAHWRREVADADRPRCALCAGNVSGGLRRDDGGRGV
eukprot:CAMPEP_0194491502 /NCGR_PEP_ID=MMETSP0253-20130528/10364_1 /TAXON_ID=2966 /ORGANISM="Noctiluca scintillans" /LENGTH=41 /DNA_ID= /DNA_START= /DNA_END= /DNA_ORIENTATION=